MPRRSAGNVAGRQGAADARARPCAARTRQPQTVASGVVGVVARRVAPLPEPAGPTTRTLLAASRWGIGILTAAERLRPAGSTTAGADQPRWTPGQTA